MSICYQCRLEKSLNEFKIKREKILRICIKCYGQIYCIHEKEKRKCQKCKGSQICKHNKNVYRCKLCSANKGINCKHNREKYDCLECKGAGICEHNRRRRCCLDCNGILICEHKINRSYCKFCKGSQVCIHGKIKYSCRDCKGKKFCVHNKAKNVCSKCNPEHYLLSLQRRRINYILSHSRTKKTCNTIEYLGCTSKFLVKYIEKQLTEEMKILGYEIDHIKPISKFNLKDPNEFAKCTHWTNLQPLLKKDNRTKSCKWSEEDEENWKKMVHGRRQTMKA